MKIVIDIPEEMYINAKKDTLCGTDILVSAIKNGTPLPKGHGRLIDADELGDICDWYHTDDDGSWCYKCKDIDNAPTIIEADKEGAEE